MDRRVRENNSRPPVALPGEFPGMTCKRKQLRGFRSTVAVPAILALCIGWLPSARSARAQVFRGYSQSGSLQMKSDLRDNGKVITTYYPSGRLEAVYKYEDGKLNGVARQYYENGVLKTETRYKKDKRDGTAKFYYPSGMLKARIEYQNDVQTGVPRLYDEKGKLLAAPGAEKPAAPVHSFPAR